MLSVRILSSSTLQDFGSLRSLPTALQTTLRSRSTIWKILPPVRRRELKKTKHSALHGSTKMQQPRKVLQYVRAVMSSFVSTTPKEISGTLLTQSLRARPLSCDDRFADGGTGCCLLLRKVRAHIPQLRYPFYRAAWAPRERWPPPGLAPRNDQDYRWFAWWCISIDVCVHLCSPRPVACSCALHTCSLIGQKRCRCSPPRQSTDGHAFVKYAWPRLPWSDAGGENNISWISLYWAVL